MKLRNWHTTVSEDLLISGVTIIGALAVMFAVEWRLALVVLLIVPVFVLICYGMPEEHDGLIGAG